MGEGHAAVATDTAETIVAQYEKCHKILESLFDEAPDECYDGDNVGCCSYSAARVMTSMSVGPAGQRFVEELGSQLRQRRAQRLVQEGACEFHDRESGCSIGSLKPPICQRTYCWGDLEETRYDERLIGGTFNRILFGTDDAGEINPEGNWSVVREFEAYVTGLREELREKRARELPVVRL